jgi:hypothetical protein
VSAELAPLPGPLPEGERVLWQGRPDCHVLARRGFHIRKLAAYLAVLLGWYIATILAAHEPAREAAISCLRMTCVAATPVLLVWLYCWISSRATTYTITNRRVVMRVGLAVPMTINLPYAKVDGAGLRCWADGFGNIALTMNEVGKITYFVLWPHAVPWRMKHPQPALRCVPDAARVAQVLARALAASADMPVRPATNPIEASPARAHAVLA